MGVTTGSLNEEEAYDITITIPGSLSPEDRERLSAALTALIERFNERYRTAPNGAVDKPVLQVLP